MFNYYAKLNNHGDWSGHVGVDGEGPAGEANCYGVGGFGGGKNSG